MRLGMIFTGGGMRAADLVTLARKAEARGFSLLCLAEAWRSGWVPLTAMAAATQRVRLGPYVLNAYGRSPLLAGMSAVDFDDLSGGRLVLGVGGGNRVINEQWQGIEHARVLTKMREYVDVLQRVARTRAGERLHYEGEVHRMDWTPAVSPREEPFPVYLAAVFPRMLRVAARVADGIAGGATLSPAYLREVVKPAAAAAAESAGRDPDGLAWCAVAVTAAHPDREYARRAAREALCHFYAPLPHPYYEYTMREQGYSETADALLELMPAGRLDAAVEAISDDCLDTLTVAGTPAECRERLAGWEGLLDDVLLLNALPIEHGDVAAAYAPLLDVAD